MSVERKWNMLAVFFGGRSCEHEISIITGIYVLNMMRECGYLVVPVYLPVEGGMYAATSKEIHSVEEFRNGIPKNMEEVWLTEKALRSVKRPKKIFAKVNRAINCCHGGGGEGGVLAALFQWNKIDTLSPQVAPSAVFIDKTLTKYFLKGLGIPVVDFVTVLNVTDPWEGDVEKNSMENNIKKVESTLGYPVIVKPSKLGSSIGVSVAKDAEELKKSLEFAFRLDRCVLVEKYLKDKRDLNCAIYFGDDGLKVSNVEEVFSDGPILSFDEKYKGECKRRSQIPAEITEEEEREVKSQLIRVHEAFRIRGVVRGDFLLSEGKVYFNELNTVPGSLATYLFEGELMKDIDVLLDLMLMNTPSEEGEILSSGILNSPIYGTKSAKRPKAPQK